MTDAKNSAKQKLNNILGKLNKSGYILYGRLADSKLYAHFFLHLLIQVTYLSICQNEARQSFHCRTYSNPIKLVLISDTGLLHTPLDNFDIIMLTHVMVQNEKSK